MKNVIIRDIDRRTSIPKAVIKKAVETVYGVSLDTKVKKAPPVTSRKTAGKEA